MALFAFRSLNVTWVMVAMTFILLFVLLFVFLLFLGKKTHALIEFKALISGKPLCLFFTDHKRVDWKVLEPEAGVIHDKKYGSYFINEKGSYVDCKTRNSLIAFNTSVATNAPIEAYALTDTLSKILNDEKALSQLRIAIANGEAQEDGSILFNGERLEGIDRIKENINFSHLKSAMNTILPHNINSKIEMQVAQKLGGFGRVNSGQIIIIVAAILGAVVLAAMLLKIYGGGGQTTTIVKEVATQVAQNVTNSNSGVIKG